jgi:hypothetical protein
LEEEVSEQKQSPPSLSSEIDMESQLEGKRMDTLVSAKEGNSKIRKDIKRVYQIKKQNYQQYSPNMRDAVSQVLIVGTLNPHTTMTALIEIDNEMEEVVIDTGAGVTVCRQEFFRKIRPGWTGSAYSGPPLRTAASKESIEVVGVSSLPLKIGNSIIELPTLIVENLSHEIIIGNDFLVKEKAVMDIGKGILHIMGADIPCSSHSLLETEFHVRTEQELIIPPRSEVIVVGRMTTKDKIQFIKRKGRYGIFERRSIKVK